MSKPAPDGRTLVRERLGLLWFVDNRTGRETARTPKQTHDFIHVWSPDSRWLLTRREGGVLRLWETATARLVGRHRTRGGRRPPPRVQRLERAGLRERRRGHPHDGPGPGDHEAGARDPSTWGRGSSSSSPTRPTVRSIAIADDGSFLRVQPEAGRSNRWRSRGLLPADGPDGAPSRRTASAWRRPTGRTAAAPRPRHVGVDRTGLATGGSEHLLRPGRQPVRLAPAGRIRCGTAGPASYQASIPLPDLTADGCR